MTEMACEIQIMKAKHYSDPHSETVVAPGHIDDQLSSL